jgi:hypothetical protein
MLREWDEKEKAREKQVFEIPRPLKGFELKSRATSMPRVVIQTIEMRNLWESVGKNWKVW